MYIQVYLFYMDSNDIQKQIENYN